MTDEKLLTVRELTVLLSCSAITIRRLVESGDIPAPLDTGRRERQWRRADFDDYFGADPDNDRPLWTAEKVGELLGVGPARVYQLAHDGALPAVRLGSRTMRWREADVRRYAGSEAPPDLESANSQPEIPNNESRHLTPAPGPGMQRVKWRGQVVRDHDGDGRWYPILKGWEGFETETDADAVLTAAIGHLFDAIPAPQGDVQTDRQAAPPAEARPDPRPLPTEAPQPDIGPGLARESEQWRAGRGSRPTREPNGSPRNGAEWAGSPGAVDSEMTGAVKWFRWEKGYGFIEPDDGSRDVFVHAATLERLGLKTLIDGERVRFSAADSPKGRQCVSLTLLSG